MSIEANQANGSRQDFSQTIVNNTDFPLSFSVTQSHELCVFVDGVLLAEADYSLVLGASETESTLVRLSQAPILGATIAMIRQLDPQAIPVFAAGSEITSDSLNQALGHLAAIETDLKTNLAQCLSYPLSEYIEDGSLPHANERAGRFLGFDKEGRISLLPSPDLLNESGQALAKLISDANSLLESIEAKLAKLNSASIASDNSEKSLLRLNLDVYSKAETNGLIKGNDKTSTLAALNSFRLAVLENAALLDMGEGISDNFQDNSGCILANLSPLMSYLKLVSWKDGEGNYRNDVALPLSFTTRPKLPLTIEFSLSDTIKLDHYRLGGASLLSWELWGLPSGGSSDTSSLLLHKIDDFTGWRTDQSFADFLSDLDPPAAYSKYRLIITKFDSTISGVTLCDLALASGGVGETAVGYFNDDKKSMISNNMAQPIKLNNDLYYSYETAGRYFSFDKDGNLSWPTSTSWRCFRSLEKVTGCGDFTAEFTWGSFTGDSIHVFGFVPDLNTIRPNTARLGLDPTLITGSTSTAIGFGYSASVYNTGIRVYDKTRTPQETLYSALGLPIINSGKTIRMQRQNQVWRIYADGVLVKEYADQNRFDHYLIGSNYTGYTGIPLTIKMWRQKVDFSYFARANFLAFGEATVQDGVVDNCFDTNLDSYWKVTAAQLHRLGCDFGSPVVCHRLSLTTMGFSCQVKVQYSDDGLVWNTASTEYMDDGGKKTQSGFEWPDCGPHRYWRLSCDSSGQTNSHYIYNMSFAARSWTGRAMRVVSSLDQGDLWKAAQIPSFARAVLLHRSATIDPLKQLRFWASRDGGNTWKRGDLLSLGQLGTDQQILTSEIDFSGTPAGQSMRWKLQTLDQNWHELQAISLQWS